MSEVARLVNRYMRDWGQKSLFIKHPFISASYYRSYLTNDSYRPLLCRLNQSVRTHHHPIGIIDHINEPRKFCRGLILFCALVKI